MKKMRKILLLIVGITLTIGLATFSYAYLLNVSNAPEHGNVQKVIVPQGKSIVFSLSKTIESINFNKDSGFTIRTLEGSQWIDMSDQAEDYTPMKGYIIRNVQEGNLEIDITFKNITNVGDLILTKTLKAGWNLIGPAHKDDDQKMVSTFDAMGNSNFSHIIDFTGFGFIDSEDKTFSGTDWIYSGEARIEIKDDELDIKNSKELEGINILEGFAYAVFVSNDTIIPGTQDLSSVENSKNTACTNRKQVLSMCEITKVQNLSYAKNYQNNITKENTDIHIFWDSMKGQNSYYSEVTHPDKTTSNTTIPANVSEWALEFNITPHLKDGENTVCLYTEKGSDNFECININTETDDLLAALLANLNENQNHEDDDLLGALLGDLDQNQEADLLSGLLGGLEQDSDLLGGLLDNSNEDDDLLEALLDGLEEPKKDDLLSALLQDVEQDKLSILLGESHEDDILVTDLLASLQGNIKDDLLESAVGDIEQENIDEYLSNLFGPKVTISISDELGEDDKYASIDFTIDNNTTNEISITKIEFENAISGSGVTLRNEENIVIGTNVNDVTITSNDTNDVNYMIRNGDSYEFKVSTHNSELKIKPHGITYVIDGKTYTTNNSETIDLGTYTSSDHVDNLLSDLFGPKVTVSVSDELGEDDKYASIDFTIDNNTTNEISITKIELENAISGSGVTLRNEENIVIGTNVNDVTITSNDTNDVNYMIRNGDSYEFKVSTHNSELKIKPHGITYVIDGKTYTTNNDTIIDLGTYTNSDDVDQLFNDLFTPKVTISISDKLGEDDKYASIDFTIDNNSEDEVSITKIELENAISGSGITLRNDDNETIALNNTTSTLSFDTNNVIKNGDSFEFKVSTHNSELKIKPHGITYVIDGKTYTTNNSESINLGTYDNDDNDIITTLFPNIAISIDNTLGAEDKYAMIDFSIDWENQEPKNIIIEEINLEASISGSGVTVRNNENQTVALNSNGNIISINENTIVKNGDSFELKVSNPVNTPLTISPNGIIFSIDGEKFTSYNNETIELGTYNDYEETYPTEVYIFAEYKKLNDREVILNTQVETIVDKSIITASGGNITLDEYILTPTYQHSLSNNVALDDIIETSTLNIGGVEYEGTTIGESIVFDLEDREFIDGIEIELLTTVTIKNNGNIINGDILSLRSNLVITSLSLLSGMIIEDYTQTILNKHGTVSIDLHSNEAVENKIVLAGSSNVVLANIAIDVEGEDATFNTLKFRAGTDDFSDTILNVNLINSSGDIIAEGGIVTYDKYTLIEFSDIHTGSQDDFGEVKLVADLREYTTNGSDTSAKLGTFSIGFDASSITGEDSNNDILIDISNSQSFDTITIIPAIVTASVTDTLGSDEKYAKIEFTIDTGNNTLDNDEIIIKQVSIETPIEGNGLTIRNGDNIVVALDDTAAVILLDDGDNIDYTVENGDSFEFKVSNSTGNAELRIYKNGILYELDGELYTINNSNILNLGEYSESN